MNILWLSHLVPYPPRAGVAQRSFGLLTELCRRHDVTFMAFHQPALMRAMSESPAAALSEAIVRLKDICARVEIFEIPSERARLGRHRLALRSLLGKDPYTINWLKSKDFASAIAAEQATKHDLIHFDTISLGVYRKFFSSVPCVMNHHNIESHLLHRRARNAEALLERLYCRQEASRLEAYEHDTAGHYDLHLTCSDLDSKRLRGIAPDAQTCVIPNGVDIDYFDARPSANVGPIFSFVGTLGWGPNRQAAEIICNELWHEIIAAWPHAKFYLVGSNPPPAARELAGRDERFVVTGFVDDVRSIMADSSFFLCPIREGGGTKLKILNAMSMGKVVVADPIACEGIDTSPGHDALTARTAEEYVHQIRALISDPAAYQRVANAARSLIERKYSYGIIGRELERQYSSLVTGYGQRD